MPDGDLDTSDPGRLTDRGDPAPHHLNPPRQGRSQKTLDRIAAAALELMEEVGVEGTTVAAIVERASASVGSFYARFPGKEDLVRYLQARVWNEARESWDEALASETWEGLPMARVVESVVGLLLRSLQADYHRRRVLGLGRSHDPVTARLVLDFHDHLQSTVTPLLLARRGEISHPDPERAAGFGYRAVVGALREFVEMDGARAAVDDGSESGTPITGDLALELSRFWMGYLDPGWGRVGAGEDGEVDFFDPWG